MKVFLDNIKGEKNKDTFDDSLTNQGIGVEHFQQDPEGKFQV
jgi:hypothetical protein